MAYNFKGIGDINVDRYIPDGTEVTAVLTEAPEFKNTKSDGSGSPFVECKFAVKGGQYDGWKIKLPLWCGTVPKEGKDKPAFESYALPMISRFYRAFFYVPKAQYAKGVESAESKAKRAPYMSKMEQFFGDNLTGEQMAKKLGLFQNKQFKMNVAAAPDKNGVTRNEVKDFVAVTEPAPA